MPLPDNLTDGVFDDLGEAAHIKRLEGDHNPPRLAVGVDGVALAEGHGILDPEVEHPLDVGHEGVAELGGGGFLGVDGHDRGDCKPCATEI